jgi:1-acyl-sn-glycerol-3-phosphate acyltransferase
MIADMIGSVLIGATRFLVGGHARWQGCAPEGRQRIYFANHASHLDTILLWAALPASLRGTTHPVAALDYWGAGRFRRFVAAGVLNAVLIDRKGGGDSLTPVREVLSRGESLIIFPEGTRRAGDRPGPFKSGLFHLAREYPQAELVPVHLANLARAYPKGAILPAPISCVVSFGAPLAPNADETRSDFLERARQEVCALAPGDSR